MEFVFLFLFALYIRDFYGKYQVFLKKFLYVFSRKLHGKPSRTYQDSDSNVSSNKNDDESSVKSLDLATESRKSITTSVQSNNRDKKAYLKSLERSLRTGRPIQDDNNNDHNHENDSHSTPLKFIRHYFNKYIRRKPSDTFESTEI